MIGSIAIAMVKAFNNWTIWNLTFKSPDFKCFRISNGRISDPQCSWTLITVNFYQIYFLCSPDQPPTHTHTLFTHTPKPLPLTQPSMHTAHQNHIQLPTGLVLAQAILGWSYLWYKNTTWRVPKRSNQLLTFWYYQLLLDFKLLFFNSTESPLAKTRRVTTSTTYLHQEQSFWLHPTSHSQFISKFSEKVNNRVVFQSIFICHYLFSKLKCY